MRPALRHIADSGGTIFIEPDLDVAAVGGEALLVNDPRWLVDSLAPLIARGVTVDAGRCDGASVDRR